MSTKEAEQQLEDALITTYLSNLLFLSEYDRDLYNRIEGLSKEIDSKDYEERYQLEFLKENGDFDIYDRKHKSYIYDKNPIKFNKKAFESIDFNSKGQFMTLDPYDFAAHPEYDNNEFEISCASDSRKLVLNDIQKFVRHLKDDLSTAKDRKIKKIKKFIFMGTLLSRHIPGIVKKIKSSHYFVCEKNLEIFRLSLFVFDYTLLVENEGTVVFSIMDDEYDFTSKFRIFHQNNSQYNHTLKYFSTNHNIEKYFDLIFDGIISNRPSSFDYQRILKNVAKHSFERINNRNVICSKIEDNNSIFSKKPVLFVGAGPSFADNIDWIKDNQDYLIIVAMGATYNKLLDFGIRVDIISSLDASYEIIEELQFHEEGLKKIKEQIILLSINTHEKIEEKFNKDNLFEFLIMSNLHDKSDLQSGYSVGEITSTLLLQLGVEELYLIGLDFSLDQATGQSHSKDSGSSKKEHDLRKVETSFKKDSFSLNSDLFKVKGNYKDEVFTNRLYNMSLNSLSKTLNDNAFKDKKIFNLSKNGAFIDKTIFIDKKDFKKNYKKLELTKLKKDLKTSFLNKSKSSLSQDDKRLLYEEKVYLELVIELLDKKSFLNVDTYEHFLLVYLDIVENLIYPNIKTSFVSPVFRTYFDTMLPYIDYCFNDKNIKSEKIKIKNVRLELDIQIRYLIKTYKKYLEVALEGFKPKLKT